MQCTKCQVGHGLATGVVTSCTECTVGTASDGTAACQACGLKGTTADQGECCTGGDNCAECGVGDTTQCTTCATEYLHDGTSPTPGLCIAIADCTGHLRNDAGTCVYNCVEEGKFGQNCAKCDADKCVECAAGSLLDARVSVGSSGFCIPAADCSVKYGQEGLTCVDLGCVGIKRCTECGLPDGFTKPEADPEPADTDFCKACSTGKSKGETCSALSGGAIAGIVVAVVVVVALVVFLCVWFLVIKKKRAAGPAIA